SAHYASWLPHLQIHRYDVLGATLLDRVQLGTRIRKRTLDEDFDLRLVRYAGDLADVDGVINSREVEIREIRIRRCNDVRGATIGCDALVSVAEFIVRLDRYGRGARTARVQAAEQQNQIRRYDGKPIRSHLFRIAGSISVASSATFSIGA